MKGLTLILTAALTTMVQPAPESLALASPVLARLGPVLGTVLARLAPASPALAQLALDTALAQEALA